MGFWLFAVFVFMLRPEDIHRGRLRGRDISLCSDGGADIRIYPGKRAAHHGVASFSAPPNSCPQLSFRSWFSALRSLTPKDLVFHKLPVLVHISSRFRGQPISTRWFASRSGPATFPSSIRPSRQDFQHTLFAGVGPRHITTPASKTFTSSIFCATRAWRLLRSTSIRLISRASVASFRLTYWTSFHRPDRLRFLGPSAWPPPLPFQKGEL